MPCTAMSDASSGAVRSSVSLMPSTVVVRVGASADRTSSLVRVSLRGRPEIMSRPRISAVVCSSSGWAEPIRSLSSSAVRAPTTRRCSFFTKVVIASSRV